MLRLLSRWLKVTFDYNPTFPLSALALMAGLRLLSQDFEGASALGTGVGLGILQAYELLLLAVALGVLWPRRIAYETTAVVIIFSVVRFAGPFLVIGLAADGQLFPALAFGAVLWLLMLGKGIALRRSFGLEHRAGWEQRYDLYLYALAALAFPLLSERLSAWTGFDVSHTTSRVMQLASWWLLAVVLAPLAIARREDVAQAGPLGYRGPYAMVWRCMTAVGMVLLLFNALWLAGDTPFLLALLPVTLVGSALLLRLLESFGWETPGWTAHVPAGLVVLVGLCPSRTLMGALPVLSQGAAVLAFFAVAVCAVPLIAPQRVKPGLRSLALIAAAGPLKFASSWVQVEGYLVVLACAVLLVGLCRREDRTIAHGALAATLLGAHLTWTVAPSLASPVFSGAAMVFALLVAWRLPVRDEGAWISTRIAVALCLTTPALEVARGVPALCAGALALGSCGGLFVLAWRHGHTAVRKATAGAGAALVLRRLLAGAHPGAVLVLIAFAALPLGTWIAVRREQEREPEPQLEPS